MMHLTASRDDVCDILNFLSFNNLAQRKLQFLLFIFVFTFILITVLSLFTGVVSYANGLFIFLESATHFQPFLTIFSSTFDFPLLILSDALLLSSKLSISSLSNFTLPKFLSPLFLSFYSPLFLTFSFSVFLTFYSSVLPAVDPITL